MAIFELPSYLSTPEDSSVGNTATASERAGFDYVCADSEGDSTLRGGGQNDILIGSEGADYLLGGRGQDHLYGGEGVDYLSGGVNNDKLYGGLGGDNLVSGLGNDKAYGGDGDDVLAGGTGRDRLDGGNDDDTVSGGVGNDIADGGEGDDSLTGDAGNDFLIGAEGSDTLNGGAGKDTLCGGAGDNSLVGGAGNDDFVIAPEGCAGLDFENTIDDVAGTNRALFVGLTADDICCFVAQDMDLDGFVDALDVELSDTQHVVLLNYFDDTAELAADSGTGAGSGTRLVFEDTQFNFEDVLDFMAAHPECGGHEEA